MKRHTLFRLLLAWIVAWPVVAAGSATPAIDVTADRLDIDSVHRTARFEGHVVARYGDLRIRCGILKVAWNDANRLVSLTASGGVRLERDDVTATADLASLNAGESLLSLTGNPVLTRGGNRLSGKQITVNLTTSKIEVLEAKGTFVLQGGVQ